MKEKAKCGISGINRCEGCERGERGERGEQPPASGRKPGKALSMGDVTASAEELIGFHDQFARVFRRCEQREWSRLYLCGQLSTLERKTIEPMVLAMRGVIPVLATDNHPRPKSRPPECTDRN